MSASQCWATSSQAAAICKNIARSRSVLAVSAQPNLVRIVVEFLCRRHLIAPKSAASRTTTASCFGTFGETQRGCCAYQDLILKL